VKVGLAAPTDPAAHAADHPPLTAIVAAPASFLPGGRGEHLFGQRLIMCAVGAAVIVMVGLLARALAGRAVGITAAVIAAVYPGLWINDGLVMAESLTVLGVTGALYWATRYRAAPSIRLIGRLDRVRRARPGRVTPPATACRGAADVDLAPGLARPSRACRGDRGGHRRRACSMGGAQPGPVRGTGPAVARRWVGPGGCEQRRRLFGRGTRFSRPPVASTTPIPALIRASLATRRSSTSAIIYATSPG